MKKQYVAPMADKVDFDYEENVVASGSCTIDPPYTPCTPCTPYPPCGGNLFTGLISAAISLWNYLFGRH